MDDHAHRRATDHRQLDRLFGTAYDRTTARDRFDRDTILSMGMDPEDLRLVTARKAYGLPDSPGKLRPSGGTTPGN